MEDQFKPQAQQFRLTISYASGGGMRIMVVSHDGSLTYAMEPDGYWENQFNTGEHRIYVSGYFDAEDGTIYLGRRLPSGPTW